MVFVGREAELDLLMREVVLAVETSSGRSVFVAGLPGAGKSTLVGEFLDRLGSERPGLAIARGRCLQTFGAADPYLPFVDALRDLADEDTQGFIRRETMAEMITELAPYWLSVVPLVGGILSAGFATAAKMRGQSKSDVAPSREALFVQYLELIKQLARQAPLVLFFDDLHWADQSSIALLNHVSRGIEKLPVVIVGTLRSDEVALEKHPIADVIRELEREDLAKRIDVGDVGGSALKALLAAQFEGEVSEPLQRWMVETAGGNPLFICELARLLKQSEAVVQERGEWFLTDAARELEVPRSAEAVIEKRIERLEPESLRLLQYASIEGNDFNSTVLARLLEEDELEVLDALEKIERRHQLVGTSGEVELPDGDVATSLRFSHALVQTVLYRQVVGKRRLLLHRKCAEILESLFADDLGPVVSKLARHFHQGRVGASAYRYACMAAEAARGVYAHWEAEELFRIALEHSPGSEETIQIEERLGDIYDTVGYYEKAKGCFASALERLTAPAEVGVRLRRKIARMERKLGTTPAPVLLQRIRSLLAEADPYPVERCHLLMDVSLFPDAVNAVEAARKALELAEGEEDPLLLLAALERISGLLANSGRATGDAFPYLERALQIVQSLGDPLKAALYHNIAGIAQARLGMFDDALREFQGMLEISERTGDPRKIAVAACNLGCTMLRIGRLEEAEEHLLRADHLHERRDRLSRVHSLLSLAERARLTGDLPLAMERYARMLELAQELEYWNSEAIAHAGLGLCFLQTDRLDEARGCAWRALAVIADRDDWFEDRDVVELFLARLEASEGRPGKGAQRLAEVARSLEQIDVFLWARMELERAYLLRESDVESARSILERVEDAARDIQSPPLQAQVAELREALFPRSSAPQVVLA